MGNLQEILEAQPLGTIRGMFYDGYNFVIRTKKTAHIKDGKIISFDDEPTADLIVPDNTLIIPGGVDSHVHVRVAHGGATHGVCMFNFRSPVTTDEEYKTEIEWMNSDLPHRRKPIMNLSGHTVVQPEIQPKTSENMWEKIFWATVEGTFEKDEQVPRTLQYHGGRRVKAHCETIADVIRNASLPHHVRRPKQAAINAVRMFLECAEKYNFIADVAHISSAEELYIVREFRMKGVRAYAELTPQQVTLDHENFEQQTGRPVKWGQQNPPLRSAEERLALRKRAFEADYFGTDHAPHTREEKEKGISGMPQADTAGQVYLELVDEGIMSLRRYIEMRSLVPGQILEERFGFKMGKLKEGYEASFTLVTRNKSSRIRDEDVLSKCGWTPYQNMTFRNTIEGVVIAGMLYTEAALKKLR